jgi:hypothetical protein
MARELSRLPLHQQKKLLSEALGKRVKELEEVTEDSGKKTIRGHASDPNELLKKMGLDPTFWKIVRIKTKENAWDVSSKWRDQDLTWDNGVMNGHAERRNDWVTNTNKQSYMELTLEPRFGIQDDVRFKKDFLKDMSRKVKSKGGFKDLSIMKQHDDQRFMLEVNLWDVHMGRFIWNEETGEIDYNTDMACERYINSGMTLLNEGLRIAGSIDQILLPIGNDFFTSDKDMPFSMTTKGTPQHLDHMWQHIYKKGRRALIDLINMLAKHAPVYIYNIPGNHDQQKSFYLADAIEIYFQDHPNVHVDNSYRETKYHRYGNSLIGFHHGRYGGNDAFKRLATTMQNQKPIDWSETYFHEWHMGDKHKQEQWKLRDEIDFQGITFKHMRSLASIDDWETGQNYHRKIGGQAYLWNFNKGKTHIVFENLIV